MASWRLVTHILCFSFPSVLLLLPCSMSWGTRLKLDAGMMGPLLDCPELSMYHFPRWRLFDKTVEPSLKAEIVASESMPVHACKHCALVVDGVPWRCPIHSKRREQRCTHKYFEPCRCWHRSDSTDAVCTGMDFKPPQFDGSGIILPFRCWPPIIGGEDRMQRSQDRMQRSQSVPLFSEASGSK